MIRTYTKKLSKVSVFCAVFLSFLACDKELGKGADPSMLTSLYITAYKDVTIGTSLNLSLLLKDPPPDAEISYKLGATYAGVSIDKDKGLLKTALSAKAGTLTVFASHPSTVAHKAAQVPIRLRLKTGFLISPNTSPFVLTKPFSGGDAQLNISKQLSNLLDDNALSYDFKQDQDLTGLSIEKTLGVVTAQPTAKRQTVKVVISQKASDTHLPGSLEVDLDIREEARFSYDQMALPDGKFLEADANEGTIDPAYRLTINVSGVGFSNDVADNENFTYNVHYKLSSVPNNLNVVVKKISSTSASIYFEGTALQHDQTKDMKVNFEWLPKALEGEPEFTDKTNHKFVLVVDFIGVPGIHFSYVDMGITDGKFIESVANDGTLKDGQSIKVKLTGATFLTDVSAGADFSPGRHYTVTGLPPGFSPKITKKSDVKAEIRFLGSTLNNMASDSRDIKLVWHDVALYNTPNLTGAVGATKDDISLVFKDDYKFSYDLKSLSGDKFIEAVANDGTLTSGQKILVNLNSLEFLGSIAADGAFVSGTHYDISNLPSNLVAKVIKKNATTAEITLAGSANSHLKANSINNIKIVWNSAAIEGGADLPSFGSISGVTKDDISIDFKDPYRFDYDLSALSSDKFTESVANDGTLTAGQKILVSLTSLEFLGRLVNDGVFTSGTHYDASDVPSGLIMQVTKKSATTAEVSFADTATNHNNARDFDAVTITWKPAAIEGGNNLVEFEKIPGTVRNDISIDFNDPYPRFDYDLSALSGDKFTESATNDGSITTGQKITIDLTTLSFTNTVNDDDPFTLNTHYTIANLPTGLAAKLTKKSTTQAELTLISNAVPHASTDGVNNITLTWKSAAIQNGTNLTGITGYKKSDISVEMRDPYRFDYDLSALSGGNFTEPLSNDGTITTTQKITVTLANLQFLTSIAVDADFTKDTHYTVANVPGGLTMKVTKKSATTAEITFTGNAAAHAHVNDVANVGITWKSTALQGTPSLAGVVGVTKGDISIDFKDPPSFVYAGTLTESLRNDGSVPDKITVTLSNGEFLSSISADADFTKATHYTITNVPGGLVMKVTKKNATTAEITFTSSATAHAHANDVANIGITWLSAALQGTPSLTGVVGVTKGDISIDFSDPPSFTYPNRITLSEAASNDGSIFGAVTAHLSNGQFVSGGLTGLTGLTFVMGAANHYTATGVPTNLTMVVTKLSATAADITFTGRAVPHTDTSRNVTITWLPKAIDGSPSLTGITGASRVITLELKTNFPAITSATYDDGSGSLVITGTNLPTFTDMTGAGNALDFTKIQLVGETTKTLDQVLDPTGANLGTRVTAATSNGTTITFTLAGTSKTTIETVFDTDGTMSSGGMTYELDVDAGAFKTHINAVDQNNAVTRN